MKTIIIGGVAGGASAAARLRRLCEAEEIILLERGKYISYANCGLPYHLSGVIEKRSSLTLQTPESFSSRFHIDVRTGHEVLSLDSSSKTLRIQDLAAGNIYTEHYDSLILAPGASPVVPDFVEKPEDPRFFTLNDIPDMDRINDYVNSHNVKQAIVIGGGFIGVETAENFKKLGFEVHIIELSPQIIAAADWDMARLAALEMLKNGVHLHLNETVKAVRSYNETMQVETDVSAYSADIVVCAVGVRPATAFLKDSGLVFTSRGAICVNERMQTGISDVYAVGDAVAVKNYLLKTEDYVPLAGPANKQGRIAADNIAGIPSTYKGTQGSSIVKIFGKTLAMTGLNERRGKNYEKVYVSVKSHASYYPGARDMWLKLIFEKHTGLLLGAQGFGVDGVDKRIDVLATAIRANMTVSQISELELCYAPPYGAAKDPVNIAAFAAQNIVMDLVKVTHGSHISSLEHEKEILVDVRTDKEYHAGHIEGCIHIPLQDLRDRLEFLPKDKTLIVYCASGMRSYMACRILQQKGFCCSSLSGGYNLYHLLYE